MANEKHTRGPWTAEIDPDRDVGAVGIEITVQGAPIASVYGSDNFPCFDDESEGWEDFPDEQEANARLMAAAPDLFAACVELATAPNEPNKEAFDLRVKSAIRMAKAAIAKARE